MKIRKSQLRKIIAEEVKKVMEGGGNCSKCGHPAFTHGKNGGKCNTKECDCDGYEG